MDRLGTHNHTNKRSEAGEKAVVRLSTCANATYPSGSTACRRAGLKHFGRLVSHLGVGHDRRGVERVRVGIGGHALLKHKTRDCTVTACKRNRTGVTVLNSQSFCASPPSCFSRWPSCCQTCRRGSLRPVQWRKKNNKEVGAVTGTRWCSGMTISS